MKTTLLTSLLTLVVYTSYGQTTLFQQDFSAGGTPANYVDAANPGIAKFTEIAVTTGTNGATTMGIMGNALEFYRPAGSSGQGRAGRGLDFAPVPTSLYVQFTFDASEDVIGGLSASVLSAATFYIGANGTANSFGNNGSSPNLNETFAKIAFNFVKAGNTVQWQIRNVGASANSATFSGKHLITWVLNRSGGGLTYVKPNGVAGAETLADKKWDIWIDGSRIFDEVAATDATVDLRRFKYIFDSGIGYTRLDDFLIRDVSGALPVTLARFSGKAQGAHVDLTWQTGSEQNSDRFSIERSADAREFAEIGSVAAAGNADGQRTYGYTDLHPLPGLNYYRLRQLDHDGTAAISKIVVIDRTVTIPDFTVLDNPGAGTFITIRPEDLAGATYRLATLTGQQLTCQQRETPEGRVTLLPQHTLPSGVYLLTASTGTIRLTRRVLVR